MQTTVNKVVTCDFYLDKVGTINVSIANVNKILNDYTFVLY